MGGKNDADGHWRASGFSRALVWERLLKPTPARQKREQSNPTTATGPALPGSPNRALNSITFGPRAVSISPQ